MRKYRPMLGFQVLDCGGKSEWNKIKQVAPDSLKLLDPKNCLKFQALPKPADLRPLSTTNWQWDTGGGRTNSGMLTSTGGLFKLRTTFAVVLTTCAWLELIPLIRKKVTLVRTLSYLPWSWEPTTAGDLCLRNSWNALWSQCCCRLLGRNRLNSNFENSATVLRCAAN